MLIDYLQAAPNDRASLILHVPLQEAQRTHHTPDKGLRDDIRTLWARMRVINRVERIDLAGA